MTSDSPRIAPTRNRAALAALHCAVLLFGIAGLFGKLLTISPLLIVAGRTLFASAVLATFLRFEKRPVLLPAASLAPFGVCGFLLAVHWTAFFESIRLSSVAIGLLTFSSFPLFVTFIEPGLSGRLPAARDLIGTLFITAGLLLVVPLGEAAGSTTLAGALWGIFSGLAFALLSIANRGLVQKYSPSLTAFYQNFFALLFLLPFASGDATALDCRSVLLLAALGVLCTALAHTLFISSLEKLEARIAAQITALEPVYGIMLAWLLLHEAPTARVLAGGAIILAAAICISIRHSVD